MSRFRTLLKTGALGAVVAIGAVAATTSPAAAYIACNRWGDCWHVNTRYHYPANLRVAFYPDAWRAAHVGPRWHWRADRADRGYYYHGRWRRF